jgi:hypothetical protein
MAGERLKMPRSQAMPSPSLAGGPAQDPFAFFSLDPGALGVGPN